MANNLANRPGACQQQILPRQRLRESLHDEEIHETLAPDRI
jgi:hypothetical protein